MVVDKDLRILTWNQRFIGLFDIDTSMLDEGRDIRPIIKRSAGQGNYFNLANDTDVAEQFAARMAIMAAQDTSIFEQTTPRGRIVEIRVSPLPQIPAPSLYPGRTTRQRCARRDRIHPGARH